jgi:hypothetical protein
MFNYQHEEEKEGWGGEGGLVVKAKNATRRWIWKTLMRICHKYPTPRVNLLFMDDDPN